MSIYLKKLYFLNLAMYRLFQSEIFFNNCLQFFDCESLARLYLVNHTICNSLKNDMDRIGKWKIYNIILNHINGKKFPCGIFGGAVRDHLANSIINDCDIMINVGNSFPYNVLTRLFPSQQFIFVRLYDIFDKSVQVYTSQFVFFGSVYKIDFVCLDNKIFKNNNEFCLINNADFDVNSLVYLPKYANIHTANANNFTTLEYFYDYLTDAICMNGNTPDDFLDEIERLINNGNIFGVEKLFDIRSNRYDMNYTYAVSIKIKKIIQNIHNNNAEIIFTPDTHIRQERVFKMINKKYTIYRNRKIFDIEPVFYDYKCYLNENLLNLHANYINKIKRLSYLFCYVINEFTYIERNFLEMEQKANSFISVLKNKLYCNPVWETKHINLCSIKICDRFRNQYFSYYRYISRIMFLIHKFSNDFNYEKKINSSIFC